MSKAGQQAWANATGFIPARNDVKATNFLDQQMVSTVSAGYNLIPRYWEATPFDIVNVAIDQFAKFMLHPGDPVDPSCRPSSRRPIAPGPVSTKPATNRGGRGAGAASRRGPHARCPRRVEKATHEHRIIAGNGP